MRQHTASVGRFKVTGYDTFEGLNADFPAGEFDSLDEALDVAQQKAGSMTLMYVHDDQGVQRGRFGTF